MLSWTEILLGRLTTSFTSRQVSSILSSWPRTVSCHLETHYSHPLLTVGELHQEQQRSHQMSFKLRPRCSLRNLNSVLKAKSSSEWIFSNSLRAAHFLTRFCSWSYQPQESFVSSGLWCNKINFDFKVSRINQTGDIPLIDIKIISNSSQKDMQRRPVISWGHNPRRIVSCLEIDIVHTWSPAEFLKDRRDLFVVWIIKPVREICKIIFIFLADLIY